jgi:ribosomal protein S18 acetylase RimI-like enzyme
VASRMPPFSGDSASDKRESRRLPDLKTTTSIVSRALGLSPDALQAAFRPAQRADLAAVVEFRRSQLDSVPGAADYLAWRYHFGQPDNGRGDLWLLERGGEILAILGTENVRLTGTCGPCTAIFLMDILVREDLRGIAIGPWMNMVLQARHDCVAVFGSNRNSNSIVTGMFAEQRQMHTYTFYLSCSRIVRRRFGTSFISGSVAGVIDVALKGWLLARMRADRAIRVERTTDSRELEPALSQWTYREGEMGRERSPAFLEWRTLRNPRSRYDLFGAWRGEQPVGYVVTRHRQDDSGRDLDIVDWHHDARDAGVPRALLVAAVERAAVDHYDAVSVSVSNPRDEALLQQLGFIRRPLDVKPFVYAAREPHPLAHCASASWRVTTLDGDVDS